MTQDVNVWSDVQVNVQSAKAAALTLSAITKANPGVAMYTGTDPANGDLMLLIVKGMKEVNYQIVRVAAVDGTGNTFELEGIDTTNFGTFVSGTAEKLTFGAVADVFTDVNVAGGESEDIPIRTIHTSQDYNKPGNFSPMVYSLGALWLPSDPALLALKAFSDSKTVCGVEIVFATGDKVYMAATPATKIAPTGSAGQAVTTPPVKLNVRGELTTYAAA
jgi:hypothetical protein